MRSPFPGMDPYIEARHRWADFHHSLISYCCAALNADLPADYAATVGARAQVEDAADQPGVLWLDDPTEGYIDILHLPDEVPVTRIDVLSPGNKSGPGRAAYLAGRQDGLRREMGLVEIDLLLGGDRLPAPTTLPGGDYYAFLTRRKSFDRCDVYAWSVRHPLPTMPVPLKAPDQDVPLDLAAAFRAAYDLGRYGRLLRYSDQVYLALSEADAAWARAVATNGPGA